MMNALEPNMLYFKTSRIELMKSAKILKTFSAETERDIFQKVQYHINMYDCEKRRKRIPMPFTILLKATLKDGRCHLFPAVLLTVTVL